MILANIFDIINQIDGQALLFFNGMHNDTWDPIMYAVSNKWIWIPFYIFLVTFMAIKKRWNVVVILLCIGLAVTFSDQLCSNVLRHSVGRMRPANLDNPLSQFVHTVNDYRGGRYGFPSSHAANTFTLAMFVSLLFRQRWIVIGMFAWALLISYSRMYLGVHYPGDILVGAMIGTLSGYLFFLLYRWLLARKIVARYISLRL